MSIDIQVANPKASYAAHAEAIDGAIKQVLDSGYYILGDEVEAFESEFAIYCQAKYSVGVGNGTDALALAMLACGVQENDEVITVAHTAVATIAAIEQIGATPVFVDITQDSRCMDSAKITDVISEQTTAILPVHIYGHMADMPAIMKVAKQHNLLVIEDCAQAHGAALNDQRAGTYGDASAFSFYPTKNLGCIGDGGAVLTSFENIHEKLIMLREYGWQPRFISKIKGINSRLDEIQAAILRVKLPYLDAEIERRNWIAKRYDDAIGDSDLRKPSILPAARHAMHLYVIETENRESFSDYMTEQGIATAKHYPFAVHQQPAYKDRIKGADALPNTESLYNTNITIPLYPQMTDQEVDRVCHALNNWSPS
jgi:dTDP-4-amino-4,6-dideoxygalactose transaminase